MLACALKEHLELLFGQHLCCLAACSIYGVARTLEVPLSFKRICSIMVKHMPILGQCTFQQVELSSGLDDGSTDDSDAPGQAIFGELRLWYNATFLPALQDKLLALSSSAHRPQPKAQAKSKRLPLKSLSAQDVNARQPT